MDLDIDGYQQGILTGLIVSALNAAGRDGRTGPWVEAVSAILARVHRAQNQALWKVNPTGGEPFGTKVTYWGTHWGTRHAVITNSPKPQAQREFLDSDQWGIVMRPDGHGSGGMTYVPAELLTLGWHPEGEQ